MSVANMLWQTQAVLHKKNNPVVPAGLLLIACSLVVYRHMTYTDGSDQNIDALKTFLAMILVQMMPLVILEMKIMSCVDPVGLFCKFAVPVTMLHAVFLSMRFCIYDSHDSSYLRFTAAGLAGAILTMYKGFHWSPRDIFHHKSVWYLTFLSLLGACVVSSLDWALNMGGSFGKEWFVEVMQESNNYLEILAFVPAVWMVCREDKNAGRLQVEELDTKRTSTAFFLFLVGFYLSEDLINAFEAYPFSHLAAAGHIVHFLLLLDFACYILAHIYNPQKLMGELRKWLPVDLSYEV